MLILKQSYVFVGFRIQKKRPRKTEVKQGEESFNKEYSSISYQLIKLWVYYVLGAISKVLRFLLQIFQAFSTQINKHDDASS